MRMSLKDYNALTGQRAKNKYNATPCQVDSYRFDSTAEALYYKVAKQKVRFKEISHFLRQVPFHLPGNTKLVVDFMEFYADRVEVIDVKGGKPTYAWTIKRKAVEALYPVTVKIIQKKEVNVLAKQYGVS